MFLESSTKVVRMKELRQWLQLSESTIYSLVAAGQFPAPFALRPGGKAKGWLVSTVEQYLREQAESRGGAK